MKRQGRCNFLVSITFIENRYTELQNTAMLEAKQAGARKVRTEVSVKTEGGETMGSSSANAGKDAS